MKIVENTKSFFKKCQRVWYVLKKPTKQEFRLTAKVTAIGIALIGIVGFIISIIISYIA